MYRTRVIFSSFLFCCFAIWATAGDEVSLPQVAEPVAQRTYTQGEPVRFQWNDFALQADSGVLMHDMAFSFALLQTEQVHK